MRKALAVAFALAVYAALNVAGLYILPGVEGVLVDRAYLMGVDASPAEVSRLDGQVVVEAGHRFLVRCPLGEALQREDVAQAVARLAPHLAAARSGGSWCLIETDIGYHDAHYPDPDQVLNAANAGASPGKVLVSTILPESQTTWWFAHFGPRLLIIAIALTAFGWMHGWRQDFKKLKGVWPSYLYLLFLPKAAGLVVQITASGVERLMSLTANYGFFMSVVYAPIVEEIVYRVLMFRALAAYWDSRGVAVVVSAVFAYGHGYDAVGTLATFASGLAFQYLYCRFGSISLPIIAHAIGNAMLLTH